MSQPESITEPQTQSNERSPKGLAALRVLRHPAMLRLWLAQILYLSVQSTASYAMIVQMTNATHSATLVGLVIIALTLPPFLFSAPAGALVDRLDRRRVLWVSNVLRALSAAVFVLVLLVVPHFYGAIYLLALFFALVGLAFSPAEGALLPSLVAEDEVLPAFSLYNLTMNVTQVIGLLVIGPLVLTLLPPFRLPVSHQHTLTVTPVALLFVGAVVCYLLAAVLIRSLPKQHHPGTPSSENLLEPEAHLPLPLTYPLPEPLPSHREPSLINWRQMQNALREGWRLVRRDPVLLEAVLHACFGSLMLLTVAGLATFFVTELLHLPTSATALIFTPAGIGLVLGSVLVPTIVARFGPSWTGILGMFCMAAAFVLLPTAQWLARLADPPGWSGDLWFLALVAALTTLIGFGLDFVIVPSQATMQDRTPDALRGRVLALYQALFNGGAIPVILFMGALTDLLGIVIVIYLLGVISLGVGLMTMLRALRRMNRDHGYETGPGVLRRDQEAAQP
jgi:MFS family permease